MTTNNFEVCPTCGHIIAMVAFRDTQKNGHTPYEVVSQESITAGGQKNVYDPSLRNTKSRGSRTAPIVPYITVKKVYG